jgi:hypothetical protein
MQTEKLFWKGAEVVWMPASSRVKSMRQRRKALLYLMMAERHRAKRDDARVIAALVRAAWRAHEEADQALDVRLPAFG